VSNTEARQILAAQSRDFNTFRRKLADAALSATVASAAERSACGKVQAQVGSTGVSTAAPDKPTLSKGSLKGQKAAEDQLAKDKQASEANARMAELSKHDQRPEQGRRGLCCRRGSSHSPSASTPAAIKAEVPGVPATRQPASTCFDTRGASRSGSTLRMLRPLLMPLRLHLPPRHLHQQRPHPRWSCLLHHPSKSPASLMG
jgi:pilus assembly protein FimV